MSAQPVPDDLMSAHTEVQRIDRTGTIWFAAIIIAVALPLTGLLISGWRPSQLPGATETVWWIGAVLTGFGVAGVGYAGCPIYWGNVRVAHLQKSIAIRGGLVLFLGGCGISLIALLGS